MRAVFAVFGLVVSAMVGTSAYAQEGERFAPGIWIDPDGCEHWVMDDGIEGFMSPHLRRDGTPVCHRISHCGTLAAEGSFNSRARALTFPAEDRLDDFFAGLQVTGVIVEAYTNTESNDRRNLKRSRRMALLVSERATDNGVTVYGTRGYGDKQQIASVVPTRETRPNRVDILCLK